MQEGSPLPEAPLESSNDVEVAIVGTGFSGLAMAIMLKQAGIHSFTLLEKASDLGGTWRENTYPGAACDVPSHLYSFSFEPNPNWSRSFSAQEEILAYLQLVARKYGITPFMRFNSRVDHAQFNAEDGRWTVHCADGHVVRARALVLGNGALHIPAWPDIPGRESFAGTAFHSATWNHAYDLNGKTVAVIGTGASAIQFVPQIAPRVGRLHLFQRTPPWILPKPDRPYRAWERSLFGRFRVWEWLYRAFLYWTLEWRAAGFVVDTRIMKGGEWWARRNLARHIKDPELRKTLTPRYRMGCKRVLLTNDYLPALTRQNVEVVTDGIEAITPAGIRTRDGRERTVDAIIYGTGFDVTRYLTPINLTGLGGISLNEAWGNVPTTYLGITVSGFPNLYLLMGPNTGLGHNSMIFMIEAQARYALQCILARRDRKVRYLDVKPEVQAAFHATLQRKLGSTVWQTGGCRSWYQDASGHNPTIWPGFTFDYWMRTRRMHPEDYVGPPEEPGHPLPAQILAS